MALDKTALATAIKAGLEAAYTAAKDPANDDDTIRQNYCNAIADAIDVYVKTMTVTFTPGTIIVTGSSTTQANPAPVVSTSIT